MTEFHQKCLTNFSIIELYDLIVDIDSYPDFLPWCNYAKIIEHNEDSLIADLGVHYKIFKEKYRSQVHLTPPNKKREAKIATTMLSGPFKHLESEWSLKSTEDGTIIDFYISFQFNSIILEKIAGSFFHLAAQKMVDAFLKRAHDLYKD